jgi:hypothetical protein
MNMPVVTLPDKTDKTGASGSGATHLTMDGAALPALR